MKQGALSRSRRLLALTGDQRKHAHDELPSWGLATPGLQVGAGPAHDSRTVHSGGSGALAWLIDSPPPCGGQSQRLLLWANEKWQNWRERKGPTDLETSLEKIWQYVQTHQLVQAPTLARAMIISKSRAAALLEDLVKAGLAERVDKKFYRARRVNET